MPRRDVRFNPEEAIFFGGHSQTHLLRQFAELSAGEEYDAIIVLTDAGGYELEDAQGDVLEAHAPVWLVHLDGELPTAYADPLLTLIQRSGGGIAFSAPEALARLSAVWGESSAILRDR